MSSSSSNTEEVDYVNTTKISLEVDNAGDTEFEPPQEVSHSEEGDVSPTDPIGRLHKKRDKKN